MFLPFILLFFGALEVSSASYANIFDNDITDFYKLMKDLKMNVKDDMDLTERLNNFNKAQQDIKNLEAQYPTATFEINKFALMSDNELKQFMNYSISTNNDDSHIRSVRSALDDTYSSSIPVSFDFRDKGKLTYIKDQGQCGSCWAFSAVAAIESQYLLRQNLTLDLSEQSLINCDTTYNYGCSGGSFGYAFQYAQSIGLPLENCFKYVATDGPQTCDTCSSPKYTIAGFQTYTNNETNIPADLYNYGPASMSFLVPRAFMYYKSGILDIPNTECSFNNNVGAHAILLMGYGPDYWIARNSWGHPYDSTTWGEYGYIRFKRGTNFCGFNNGLTAPYLTPPKTTKKTTTPSTTTPPPPSTTAKAPITQYPNQKCENGWTYFNETKSCYSVIYNCSFYNCEIACKKNGVPGGHLASIHSATENKFVNDLAATGSSQWDFNQTIIGFQKLNTEWSWTDQTPFDYNNFAPGQPDFSQQNQYCGLTYSDVSSFPGWYGLNQYLWDDNNCFSTARSAVCKKPAFSLKK